MSLYFTMGRPFPPQNCPFRWGSGPPSNTWFLGSTRVHNPNGITISSAVFAWLTSVTDRQTDRQTDRPRYSIGNNRPHLRSSTATRLNNKCFYFYLKIKTLFKVNVPFTFCYFLKFKSKTKLEMWANAQPDGRPAEYRWRPLFNAAKFG